MAIQSCPITKFVDDAVCYGMHKLNPAEQKALLIYAYALELKAIGGADYTNALSTTLQTDAACLYKLNADQRMAGFVNVAFVEAIAAGADGTPAALNDKLDAVKCLKLVPMERLDALLLYLTCLLGPEAPQ